VRTGRFLQRSMKGICGTKDTCLSEVVGFPEQLPWAVWTALRTLPSMGVADGRYSNVVDKKKVE